MFKRLAKLRDSNKINEYLYKLISQKLSALPEPLKDKMLNEAEAMTALGISSEEEHKNFLYILSHTKSIAKDLSGKKLNNHDIAKIAGKTYKNLYKNSIDSILNFYIAVQGAMQELNMPIKKLAYPTGYYNTFSLQPHSVKKWMQTMQDIYAAINAYGIDYDEAFKIGTRDWDNMEKQDFDNWIKFYQENAHMKYKTAKTGSYYLHEGGGVIPMDQLRASIPQSGMPDMSNFKALEESTSEAENRAKEEDIKKKIKSIVSRLNAAERIATIPEVQRALHKVLDIGVNKWLEELQKVKRFVQTAPIKSVGSPIIEDLIYKQGNILSSQGFPKAGKLMKHIAQIIDRPEPQAVPQGPEEMTPGLPEMTEPEEDEDAWVKDLVDALNFDGNDTEDEDVEKEAKANNDDMAYIFVEAQDLPIEQPDIEVEEDSKESGPRHNLDDLLTDVTIEDVVERLDAVANILKNREIPRQLAIIDLMMHKLGIGSFFPALAEANRSALESNQYMSTRIDDILSKLRGSIASTEIDLAHSHEDEAVEDLKEKLTEKERQEKERQEARKIKREAPSIDVEEALEGPVEVEGPAAAPIEEAPAAPVR